MTVSDYEEALALWQSTPGIGLSAADSRDAITRFLERNGELCFVARRGAQLVGTVLCGHDARRGYIYHLAVRQGERRAGVGRALVQKALEALGRQDIQKCHIFVYADNQEGLLFWRSTGWLERPELIIMSKDIP
ncbi:MAG: GNAT family N-acetyltransferase [Anaerolineae bacterium]|nr:GNAT family N-acetyltransferase [Anaerolineae bacterium]